MSLLTEPILSLNMMEEDYEDIEDDLVQPRHQPQNVEQVRFVEHQQQQQQQQIQTDRGREEEESIGSDLMKRQEDDFSQSPSRLEEEFAKLAGAAAWERVQELQCRSRLPTNTNRELFYLTWNDITVEGLLGVGGFGCVCLTTIPKLLHQPI